MTFDLRGGYLRLRRNVPSVAPLIGLSTRLVYADRLTVTCSKKCPSRLRHYPGHTTQAKLSLPHNTSTTHPSIAVSRSNHKPATGRSLRLLHAIVAPVAANLTCLQFAGCYARRLPITTSSVAAPCRLYWRCHHLGTHLAGVGRCDNVGHRTLGAPKTAAHFVYAAVTQSCLASQMPVRWSVARRLGDRRGLEPFEPCE